MFKPLTKQQIKNILETAGISTNTIQKLDVGFSNDLYLINDAYILKAGKSQEDVESLGKELFFCKKFANITPSPKIVHQDLSQKTFERPYIIFEKLHGENLYNVWHTLDDATRKDIIKQICGFLRKINESPYEDYLNEFGLESVTPWKEQVKSGILQNLQEIVKGNVLSKQQVGQVKKYVNGHIDVLEEEKQALTYYDVHFDNFLVENAVVTGMVDFERTEIKSIDYVLDIATRVVKFPKKYASEYAGQFAVEDDYKNLLEWYKEFYPAIFDFTALDTRLNLYSIEHDLLELKYWPNSKRAKTEVLEIVSS